MCKENKQHHIQGGKSLCSSMEQHESTQNNNIEGGQICREEMEQAHRDVESDQEEAVEIANRTVVEFKAVRRKESNTRREGINRAAWETEVARGEKTGDQNKTAKKNREP